MATSKGDGDMATFCRCGVEIPWILRECNACRQLEKDRKARENEGRPLIDLLKEHLPHLERLGSQRQKSYAPPPPPPLSHPKEILSYCNTLFDKIQQLDEEKSDKTRQLYEELENVNNPARITRPVEIIKKEIEDLYLDRYS